MMETILVKHVGGNAVRLATAGGTFYVVIGGVKFNFGNDKGRAIGRFNTACCALGAMARDLAG